jgi:hypothetical protein
MFESTVCHFSSYVVVWLRLRYLIVTKETTITDISSRNIATIIATISTKSS